MFYSLILFFTICNTNDPTELYYIPEKNPNFALMFSILPGGGQFYTQNYLKAGAFCLLQSAALGMTIYYWVQTERAKARGDLWEADWYSNQRYNWFWIDGFVWSLSMMDAYISAHFYKFKEQAKLEIGFRF